MVFDEMMNIFTSYSSDLFDALPNIKLQFLVAWKPQFAQILSVLGRVFDGINYFVPLDVFLGLEAITFSFILFRVAYATLLRIKSFIPTLGN